MGKVLMGGGVQPEPRDQRLHREGDTEAGRGGGGRGSGTKKQVTGRQEKGCVFP